MQWPLRRRYPNPTNSSFTIVIKDPFKNSQNLIVSIYDNIGKLVNKIPLTSNQNIFNLSLKGESAGIYYVVLNGDGLHYSAKIIRTN